VGQRRDSSDSSDSSASSGHARWAPDHPPPVHLHTSVPGNPAVGQKQSQTAVVLLRLSSMSSLDWAVYTAQSTRSWWALFVVASASGW